MKFLLKQKLNYRKEQTIYYIYPNLFSSQIVREANKRGLILDVNKKWRGKYYNVDSYEILENDFKRLLTQYKKRIQEKRNRFYKKDPMIQLILILKYIFNRNIRAKEVSKYYASQKAYDDKKEFLELALNIAKNIKNNGFKYGFQEDPSQSYHNIIYYFQIGKKQVSFHSNKLHSDCPKFKEKWIGYRNEEFPFKLKKIKKILKNSL